MKSKLLLLTVLFFGTAYAQECGRIGTAAHILYQLSILEKEVEDVVTQTRQLNTVCMLERLASLSRQAIGRIKFCQNQLPCAQYALANPDNAADQEAITRDIRSFEKQIAEMTDSQARINQNISILKSFITSPKSQNG